MDPGQFFQTSHGLFIDDKIVCTSELLLHGLETLNREVFVMGLSDW
jgi:hypothetical protein